MLDFQKSVIIIYFWVINVNQFYNLIKYLNVNRSQYWHLLWDCKRKEGQNKTYTVIQNVLVNEGSDKKLKWKIVLFVVPEQIITISTVSHFSNYSYTDITA